MNRSGNSKSLRKIRAKYRRNIRIAIVLCLIIGLAGGFVLGRFTAGADLNPIADIQSMLAGESEVNVPAADPTQNPLADRMATPEATVAPTDVPTAQPTAEITAEPTAEPTPAPTAEPKAVEEVIPYGETGEVSVQVYGDGSIRKAADALPFENLTFALNIERYLSNDYYNDTYGATHRLVGNEAGVEFTLMLKDYMGAMTIDPNALLKNTGVENEAGVITLGYRFTDKEISGSDNFTMTTNVPMVMYKRFDNTAAEMKYLTVSTYVDGVEHVYKFELGAPVAEVTPEPVVYTELTVGSSGEAVVALQARLIELGYLTGSADGAFGNMTATAVQAAQTAFGMTADGIATPDFQTRLFAAN